MIKKLTKQCAATINNTTTKTVSEWICYFNQKITDNGIVGPQGPQGVTGPAGPQGMQGEVGPQGPVGPEGPEGPQGPQGPVGQQGQPGAQGPTGKSSAEVAFGFMGKTVVNTTGPDFAQLIPVIGGTIAPPGYQPIRTTGGPSVQLDNGSYIVTMTVALAADGPREVSIEGYQNNVGVAGVIDFSDAGTAPISKTLCIIINNLNGPVNYGIYVNGVTTSLNITIVFNKIA